jgi:hypothetical protein
MAQVGAPELFIGKQSTVSEEVISSLLKKTGIPTF